MDDSNVTIIGAIDGLHSSGTPFGWAIEKMDNLWGTGTTLSFFATLDGRRTAINSERHYRGDLKNWSACNTAGFVIRFKENVTATHWLENRIQLFAQHEGRDFQIKTSSRFFESIHQQLFIEQMATADRATIERFFAAVSRARNLDGRITKASKLVARMFSTPSGISHTGEGTPVFMQVGTSSIDGFAVLGRQGHVFLTGGTNGVRELYTNELSPADSTTAGNWHDLLLSRSRQLAKHQYLQLIIPEKLSVLPDLFPDPITTPSRLLRAIEQQIAKNDHLSRRYLSCLDTLQSSPHRFDLYHRTDTHLSEIGSYVLFSAITERLGPPSPQRPEFPFANRYWLGDLSDRFYGEPILSPAHHAIGTQLDDIDKEITLVSSYDPPSGHIGKRRVWKNHTAPYKSKVVAFANSFFESGSFPRQLSWWFSRYFSEFHFIWTPEVDYDYIKLHNPDIVVCQTIERFLRRTPTS